jgi:hypothetical protein
VPHNQIAARTGCHHVVLASATTVGNGAKEAANCSTVTVGISGPATGTTAEPNEINSENEMANFAAAAIHNQ